MRRPAVYSSVVPNNAPALALDSRRLRRLRLGLLTLIILYSAIPAISDSGQSAELTTVRQIRHLKASAPADINVHLRGVVTSLRHSRSKSLCAGCDWWNLG